MAPLFIGLWSGLTLSSPASAQGVDTREISSDRVKVIDVFPQPSPDEERILPIAGGATPELPAPIEETFFLHSNPGASKVVYLDFDGHVVEMMGGDFVYDSWSMDDLEDRFSVNERTVIQLTWQSVAEDFIPFDLNVTTEDPGVEALRNTGGDDEEWGVRAVINHINYSYSWAYQGSFTDSEDIELYAWTGRFDSIDETWLWTADSVSHEVGHALGLSHDGTITGVEYYEGHGEGETSWSPIMGWTNYGLSQWSLGEYTYANNDEDDLGIITSFNGFGFRPDDHGSSIETATPVDIELSSIADGIIEQPTDVDYFSFTVAKDGWYWIGIETDNLAPNLDIAADLYDSDGTLLGSSNPPTALDAEFHQFFSEGTYFLSVDGTGYDDPESDGYSDYGSLGSYRVVSRPSETTSDSADTADEVDTGDTGDTGDTEDTPDTEDTTDTGDTQDTTDTEDATGTEDAEDTASSESTEDTGNVDKPKDPPPEEGCNCNTQSGLWLGWSMLLPAFMARRRTHRREEQA